MEESEKNSVYLTQRKKNNKNLLMLDIKTSLWRKLVDFRVLLGFSQGMEPGCGALPPEIPREFLGGK